MTEFYADTHKNLKLITDYYSHFKKCLKITSGQHLYNPQNRENVSLTMVICMTRNTQFLDDL